MTILDEIIAKTRDDLQLRKRELPFEVLKTLTEGMPKALSFKEALTPKNDNDPRMICELKKASPSKGLIRANFTPVSLAEELEKHGAAALSVLTEPHYFQGSPGYLKAAVEVVSIPALRKDFIVEEYQIYEAKYWGASAFLLIAAALKKTELKALYELGKSIGLDVLTEVHNDEELDMVLDIGVDIIGVNSRNLKTFKTDLDIAAKMMGKIPDTSIRVAESGVNTLEDVLNLKAAGAHAFLVGESLMREENPGLMLDKLLGKV